MRTGPEIGSLAGAEGRIGTGGRRRCPLAGLVGSHACDELPGFFEDAAEQVFADELPL